MDNGLVSSTTIGVLQGGLLLPILSNIYLDKFDKELEMRGLHFVRYADDCNIFVKSEMSADYQYQIIDSSYIILLKYLGNDAVIEVPEEINGLPVIGIKDLCFENKVCIKTVYIPQTIVMMGGGIFVGCENIESLDIPRIYNMNFLWEDIFKFANSRLGWYRMCGLKCCKFYFFAFNFRHKEKEQTRFDQSFSLLSQEVCDKY